MPIHALVFCLAALAALFTLGVHAADQTAPQDPAAQYQLATEFFEDARYREAVDAYDLATQADDDALVTRARKGKVRASLRIAEFEPALREAEELMDDPAADAESQTLLADALWATGSFDEADTVYREALDETPGLSRARFGLARSLATRSKLDEALTEALITAAAAPQDAEVQALVGLVYERLNRYEEAADAYERYIALLPSREDSTMSVFFASKVRLLRSFGRRVPLQMEDAAGLHRVKFRLVNNKIVLQGRVNWTPVEFVLDTGSEHTGLSDATARRAGVRAVTSTITAGVGIGSLRRLDLGRAERIEIGSLKMRNVPVAIRGVMRGALPRWQNETLSPLSLGLSVGVDYQRKEVTLARTLPDGEADFRLPMRMNRLPLVRGMLNETHPAYFVVDTGGELISISAETADSLSMTPVRRIPLRVFGMSGIDNSAFLLPGVDLDFDEIEYRNVGLAVLNLRAPSVLLGFQVGGIVGHSFLADYRVSMDLGRSELRLEKF